MKNGRTLAVIYALSFIFVLIGSTMAYFTMTSGSATSAAGAKSSSVGISLLAEPLYNEKKLVPLNDSDVMTAYNSNCVDINDYGACHAYTITITNAGNALTYDGYINFELTNITNLNYMILDEDDEVYKTKTEISAGNWQTLGNSFTLAANETKVFTLIIWVPNYEYDQNSYDGGGVFSAIVKYAAQGNVQISGSITGS